jgi:2-oxoglutarate dehydrogenase E2 component (dihydrolipoamide succinyltransferase)
MSQIVVPELGESVVEARVARWLKKEGDRVETGEPLVELETEKIDLEVSADRPGVLTSIKRKEGEDVKIGEVLAVVDEGASGPADGAAVTAPASPSNGHGADEARTSAPVAPTSQSPVAPNRSKIAPTSDSIAPTSDSPIAPNRPKTAPTSDSPIAPSRSTTAPTNGSIASTSAPPIAPASALRSGAGDRTERRVRMTKRRETIARRLVEAQHTAAMLTTFNEVDMTSVMDIRARHKETFAKQYGSGLGIVSFFVKASIAALRAFPQLNAEIQGDEIVLKNYYDIGIAVGAEGGLVVPVLRDADKGSFAQIELAIREFAKKANDGTLTLEDLAGGTFTITNGGVFGSLLSTPILNPPQVGILGLHKIQDRPLAFNGQVVIRPMMYVALSYDHRIVDGREAVQFLVKIKELVEDPGRLLLEN